MKITKRTNLAVRVLMYCAAQDGGRATKSQIATVCNSSENHLAQVINQLSHMGVLQTTRGRLGGLKLARPASEIHIGPIFREIEAQVPITECFADVDNTCPLTEACRLRNILRDAAEAFYARLDEVSLDDLVCDNIPLIEILCPQAAA